MTGDFPPGDHFWPFAVAAAVLVLLAAICMLLGLLTFLFAVWKNGG